MYHILKYINKAVFLITVSWPKPKIIVCCVFEIGLWRAIAKQGLLYFHRVIVNKGSCITHLKQTRHCVRLWIIIVNIAIPKKPQAFTIVQGYRMCTVSRYDTTGTLKHSRHCCVFIAVDLIRRDGITIAGDKHEYHYPGYNTFSHNQKIYNDLVIR